MVVFDTNVFMNTPKDRNIILSCIKAWEDMHPPVYIVIPRVRNLQQN